MLKLIPQENSDAHVGIKKIRYKVFTKKKKVLISPKLQQKYQHEARTEKSVLERICKKLLLSLKGDKNLSQQEIGELIHGLQKSILGLQRQRQRLLWQEQKKKKQK